MQVKWWTIKERTVIDCVFEAMKHSLSCFPMSMRGLVHELSELVDSKLYIQPSCWWGLERPNDFSLLSGVSMWRCITKELRRQSGQGSGHFFGFSHVVLPEEISYIFMLRDKFILIGNTSTPRKWWRDPRSLTENWWGRLGINFEMKV